MDLTEKIELILRGHGGSVRSKSGQVTSILGDEMENKHDRGVIGAAIRRLEESGKISRVVRGRRTYEIVLIGHGIESAPSTTFIPIEPRDPFDYGLLADTLLQKVVAAANRPVHEHKGYEEALRNMGKIQEENARLRTQTLGDKTKLQDLQEEIRSVRNERDGLRVRVRQMEEVNTNLSRTIDAQTREGVREALGRELMGAPREPAIVGRNGRG